MFLQDFSLDSLTIKTKYATEKKITFRPKVQIFQQQIREKNVSKVYLQLTLSLIRFDTLGGTVFDAIHR